MHTGLQQELEQQPEQQEQQRDQEQQDQDIEQQEEKKQDEQGLDPISPAGSSYITLRQSGMGYSGSPCVLSSSKHTLVDGLRG